MLTVWRCCLLVSGQLNSSVTGPTATVTVAGSTPKYHPLMVRRALAGMAANRTLTAAGSTSLCVAPGRPSSASVRFMKTCGALNSIVCAPACSVSSCDVAVGHVRSPAVIITEYGDLTVSFVVVGAGGDFSSTGAGGGGGATLPPTSPAASANSVTVSR